MFIHALMNNAIGTVQYGPILHCSSPYIFNYMHVHAILIPCGLIGYGEAF